LQPGRKVIKPLAQRTFFLAQRESLTLAGLLKPGTASRSKKKQARDVWKSLSPEHDQDPRVLKAQLDVIAGVSGTSWVTTPLWALGLAWLGSSSCGYFGSRDIAVTMIFPVIVTLVSFISYAIYARYRKAAPADPAALARWTTCFLLIQVAISAAWGLFPWIVWTKIEITNSLFILLAVCATLSSLMLSRASDISMFLAGMIPMVTLTALRFAFSDAWIDIVFAPLVPLYGLHLFVDGRRFISRMQENVRLRFNVEDLAAAVTKAKDEAVRKRYEAESASASKTAFLANMSHELRTPLNAILGFSDLIAHQAMGPNAMTRYSEYARDIHGSGEHLLSLINDLLDVAKIEAGKMQIDPMPLDPLEVVGHAARLMEPRLAEKNQTFSIDLPPETPLLLADERALRQILLNLLSNAAKFTQAGGAIAVSGGPDDKGGFNLCVSDNGPGIAEDKLARVFQPFSQIDNRYDRQAGGTGLGLALVQGLVQLHGGRVWLESGEGKGVKAHIYFPSTLPRPELRKTA
jgi:two-component system, cell cycle sensor histidine kinase PleC